MASPRAADLPLPLAAVRETVERNVFSEMASTNFNKALAWSIVLANKMYVLILDQVEKLSFDILAPKCQSAW